MKICVFCYVTSWQPKVQFTLLNYYINYCTYIKFIKFKH